MSEERRVTLEVDKHSKFVSQDIGYTRENEWGEMEYLCDIYRYTVIMRFFYDLEMGHTPLTPENFDSVFGNGNYAICLGQHVRIVLHPSLRGFKLVERPKRPTDEERMRQQIIDVLMTLPTHKLLMPPYTVLSGYPQITRYKLACDLYDKLGIQVLELLGIRTSEL